MILHIDLGNQSLQSWLTKNKYIVFSELVRYCEKLIKNKLDSIFATLNHEFQNQFQLNFVI